MSLVYPWLLFLPLAACAAGPDTDPADTDPVVDILLDPTAALDPPIRLTQGDQAFEISLGQARGAPFYSLRLVNDLDAPCGFGTINPSINLSVQDAGQGDLTQRGTASLFTDSAIFYPELGWVRVDTISETEITGAMAWETVPEDGSPAWRAVGGFSVPYCP